MHQESDSANPRPTIILQTQDLTNTIGKVERGEYIDFSEKATRWPIAVTYGVSTLVFIFV